MNKHGQAARFAYNPEAVLAFLKTLDDAGGKPTLWTDSIHGRTVRRWRTAKGITRAGLNKVLVCYPGIGESEYVAWAEANGYAPTLRDHRTQTKGAS